MIATSPMLHLSNERITSPSRPAMAAAAAAIARCCGESILAGTPPVLFPGGGRVGEKPASAPPPPRQPPKRRFRPRARAGDRDAEPADQRRDQRESAVG